MKTKIYCSLLALSLMACQSTKLPENKVNQIAESKVNQASHTKPKYEEFVKTGDYLPITSIVDINGNAINLANIKKKKLVILFATWCSDSNRALKALNDSPLLDNKSIEVVAIAREEDKQTVIQWRDKNNIKVALAVDPNRDIYKKFAKAGIPRLITVNQNNKIIKMNLAEGENQLNKVVW